MENKAGPWVSGVGGAAILALFLAPTGGAPSRSPVAEHSSSKSITERSSPAGESSHSDSGPWSAICKEYETDDFDHEQYHSEHYKGAWAHTLPQAAHSEALEYTTHTPYGSGGTVDEKFQVKSHPVGNPSDCIKDWSALDALVVTIPDPLASHFAMYFDRSIEALEQAAASDGYSLSQYWLPWDMPESTSGVGYDAIRFEEWKAKSGEPGVLAFHRADGKRLFMFLVGETPTLGIERFQFARALLYAQQMTAKSSNPRSLLRIAGPHFSGSLLGMQEVLARPDIVSPKNHFHIVSPDAGSDTLIGQFIIGPTDPKLPNWLVDYSSNKARQEVSTQLQRRNDANSWFFTLTPGSDVQLRAAFDNLDLLGYEPSDIAILSEDESAFSVATGVAFHTEDSETLCAVGGSKEENALCRDEENQKKILKAKEKLALHLAYPRDLSSLRNKTDSFATSDPEINGIKLPLWSVPLSLGEKVHLSQDSPHTFASDQEASRIDHALQAIVMEMRQHKTRAVFISASNNLDTLFLLEYLMRARPNMRFETVSADEFEIGRPQNVDLTGTVSVTNLPLLRDSIQKLNNEKNISFGSNDAEGTYLAAVLLVRDIDLRASKMFGGAECSSGSVVGNTGFMLLAPQTEKLSFPCVTAAAFPLDLLTHPQATSSGPGRGSFRSWTILLFGVLIATGVHLLSLWRSGVFWREEKVDAFGVTPPGVLMAALTKTEHIRKQITSLFSSGVILSNDAAWYRPRSWSYPTSCGAHDPKRINVLFALNNQYLILQFAMCMTTFSLGKLFAPRWIQGLLFFGNVALLLFCIVASFALLIRWFSLGKSRKYRLYLITSILYLLATLAMWMSVLEQHGLGNKKLDVPLHALRISLLAEGISPLIPFAVLTLAYIAYFLVELYGIDWAAHRHIWLRFDNRSEKVLYFLQKRLQKRLEPFPSKSLRILVYTWLGTLIGGTVFGLHDALSGFDGPIFKNWLIYFAFSPLIVLIAFNIYRAWRIWARLKDILQWLQETRLQRAFATLHERDLPKLRVWDLGKREQDLTICAQTVQSLERLFGREKAAPARAVFENIRRLQAKGKQHTWEEANQLAKELHSGMGYSLPFLFEEPIASDPTSVLECQRYLALRFVALIRYSLLHIRNLYTFVVYGFASLAVCVVSYPFEGRSHLSILLAVVFVFILLSVSLMMAEMQRNPTLSIIEGSDIGKVSYLDLAKHLLSVGGVPALIVIATQFPALAQVLTSWAKPGLDLLK